MLHHNSDLQRSSRGDQRFVRQPLDPNNRLRIHGPIQPLDEPSLVSRFMDFLRTV